MLDGYLNGRGQEDEAEVPVMYTEPPISDDLELIKLKGPGLSTGAF